MKAGRLIIKWTVGILLAVLLLCAGVLKIISTPKVLGQIIDKFAPEFIDGELSHGKVELSLFRHFPTISLDIENLAITYPAERYQAEENQYEAFRIMSMGRGEQKDTLASLSGVSLSFNILEFLSEGIYDVPDAEISGLRAFLKFFNEDTSNLDVLTFLGRDTTKKSSLPPIEIGRLAVDDKTLVTYCRPDDAFLLRFDNLVLGFRDRRVNLDASVNAGAETKSFGRLDIPLSLNTGLYIPKDSILRVDIDSLRALIADIPLSAGGNLAFYDDSTRVDVDARIDDCSADYFLNHFARLYWSKASEVDIKSRIALEASCNGVFSSKLGLKPNVSAKLNNLCLKGAGLDLDVVGTAKDILGGNGLYDADAKLDADLKKAMALLPEGLGINASGKLNASVKGKISQSQLGSLNKMANTNLTAGIRGKDIVLSMPQDTLDAYIDGLDVNISAKAGRKKSSMGSFLVSLAADTLDAAVKDNLYFTGKDVGINARTRSDFLQLGKTTDVLPVGGKVSASRLSMRTKDSLYIAVEGTDDSFSMLPKKDNAKVPVISLMSSNDTASLMMSGNRIEAGGLSVDAKVVKNSSQRKAIFPGKLSVLAQKYPDVPKDSLMLMLRKKRQQEDEFRSSDIKFNFGDGFKKLYRTWNLDAGISIANADIDTPAIPLKTDLSGLKTSVTNDVIKLDGLNVNCGESNISLDGEISDIRRFLIGHGSVYADMNLGSTRLNVDELLGAIKKDGEESTEDTTAVASALLVVPGNVDAKLNVDLSDVEYDGIAVSGVSTMLDLRDRCFRLSNTVVTSDFANLLCEGFYSTKNKEDLKAGFSLGLMDVDAEQVVEMFPALDTIVPILSSMSGLVNLELAATTQFDTLMRLQKSTMNGVVRVHGTDLALYDSDFFQKYAKILMFKDTETGYVDDLMIEGLLMDNKLEVFPFVLSMDRYKIALNGLQDLDSSFKYHASVLKSPLPFKLGIDLWGNFSDVKFGLGRPKYKSVSDVPTFSDVVDSAREALSKSIRNIFSTGADKAVKDSRAHKEITDFKKRTGYVSAIDQKLDSLSTKEIEQLDSLQNNL